MNRLAKKDLDMKKLIFLLSILVAPQGLYSSDKHFVTTIPPLEMILKEVVADQADIERLLPIGASAHAYEPKPSQVKRIHEAQAFFYVSEHLDGWATQFVDQNHTPLFGFIDWLPQEYQVKGEHDHQSEGHHHHESHSHHSDIADPHFWMDPLAVKATLPQLQKRLCKVHQESCNQYKEQIQKFSKKLDTLHQEIKEELAEIKGAPVITAHNFLDYLFKRYDLKHLDVLERIPGKEPTAQHIAKVVHQIAEHKVKALFQEPQIPSQAAQAAVTEAKKAGHNISLASVDPLGGVEGRMTYEELIRFNVESLVENLR